MQLYNTLTRKKEEFVPVRPGKVNMYVCGITAYDYCHIGHARSALVFDVLVRHLRALGLDVTFVRNFTDVDDKIIRRANEEKRDWREVGQTYIDAFHEDMDRLNVVRADHEPRATEYIQQMQDLCSELIAQGKAYAVPSGDVYFRVRAYPPYGKLSGRSLDELQAGAAWLPVKRSRIPWILPCGRRQAGEPFWESPGARAVRLAYRMLGHEQGISAPGYPRRRPGPHLPPSRERDRPDRSRLQLPAGPFLGA